MTLVPPALLLSALFGWALARRMTVPFALPWRLVQATAAVSVVLPSAWTLRIDLAELWWVLLLVAVEVVLVLGLSRRDPTLSQLSRHNSGFWALPVVAAVSPAALPAAVVYDTVSHVQLSWHLHVWRRTAPPKLASRSSRLLDYLPVAAAGAGLSLNVAMVAPPAWLAQLPPRAVLPLGLAGFFLLGAALPSRPPAPGQLWLLAPGTLAVRFLPAGMVAVAALLGAAPPVWVVVAVAAPAAFVTLAWARMFAGDVDVAWARLLLTLLAASVLTPALLWLLL